MPKIIETLVASTADAVSYVETRKRPDGAKPSIDLIDRIDVVNGRATRFTTSCYEAIEVALKAELRLALSGIPKSARVGAIVKHCGAGPTAKSYKGACKATLIQLRRKAGGWYLTSVTEKTIYAKTPEYRDIIIQPEQAERVVANAMTPYTVVDPSPAALAA